MTTPSNDLAKLVAGTFIADSQGKAKQNPVYAWVQRELREGSLKEAVDLFSKGQPEFLEPSLVLVENIGENAIECVIPCKAYDHESTGTFLSEVRFTLNPTSGHAQRQLSA
jgi:hypothetical protein